MTDEWRRLAGRLEREVLGAMKQRFVGKDTIIDLLGISLVAGENLFILGPPGTAKSALVTDLGRRLSGQTFEYLLTRFTEPNELFGPFDIRRLREGELTTNTEGMLPEATLVFLDELLNANSAILNGLLMVLNERVFRRGRERWDLPTLMVVGASNHLPEDDALQALFDRFLLRVRSDNVGDEHLAEVLEAGWRIETGAREAIAAPMAVEEVRALQGMLPQVDLEAVRGPYGELVRRLRGAGISVSDRRAVKLQRLIAASAVLCGRLVGRPADLWVLRHIWDAEEEVELLAELVGEPVDKDVAAAEADDIHPQAAGGSRVVDADALGRDLASLREQLGREGLSAAEMSALRDRLSILASRCEWVSSDEARGWLREQVEACWPLARGEAPRP